MPLGSVDCTLPLELHCPLPLGSEEVFRTDSTAHGPQPMWQCIVGLTFPLPPGTDAVCRMSSTTHCP